MRLLALLNSGQSGLPTRSSSQQVVTETTTQQSSCLQSEDSATLLTP